MQLEVSAEVLLLQLGYSKSETSLEQAQKVISSTKNFTKFAKHIFSLNDHLKKMNAYIGLSNKTSYLKIKCDENDSDEIIKEFHQDVQEWAKKYNIQLEKSEDKRPIYYVLGTN